MKKKQSKAPKIAPFLPVRELSVGKSLKLLCYLEEGSPEFRFDWFHNGHKLSSLPPQSSSSHSSLTSGKYSINLIDAQSSLFQINAIELNDLGNYSCMVQNRFGSDFQSTTIEIKGLKIV
ncbi:cell adhesion molecule-like protein 13 [Sarcoptes scabiei]|uniref:Cell adhesion molecule-like protein 13 n=1 Tax=Sarcoptes scabiei TaxID=52283 RepID=A0A132AG03_SARSC|nr:cell adhesion molecule-like protein 13 [Sarcoptes scabiei]